ncbi:dTDP-4-dehydrorhamnose reductase [Bacillus sp. FJAT-49711]|uniref:dTDP-4-dehydrorhamnose reductase n=1 Tax=Bacillus sp. FJAT-49711 TaxID=2833585 RepID=UPI001BCA52A1|nr:dTDP-4-dehydrorhamnose reductase [Bacillus sp. FJAT-49711]MBS4216902.1 dTDP-4-dehydrorhamnose reductase [Bacillus sp. FJAT-49711]
MKFLVTGANGQLGREVVNQFQRNHVVKGYGKSSLDITNLQDVMLCIQKEKPDIIIHAAAYTAVDDCESNIKNALLVNALGAAHVALSAKEVGARMFYISTDYVFNGKKGAPFIESDSTDPLSIYGLSKYAGELMVQIIKPDCTIIRTSWLYGHEGKNFVKTMSQLAKEEKMVKVVYDQIGSPTYTVDLVEVIKALLDKPDGIYHVTNSGECSWFQFAQSIYKEMGKNQNLVIPCSTDEYGALAKRPNYSVLANDKIKSLNITPPRKWEDALIAFLRKESAND